MSASDLETFAHRLKLTGNAKSVVQYAPNNVLQLTLDRRLLWVVFESLAVNNKRMAAFRTLESLRFEVVGHCLSGRTQICTL